MTSREPKVSEQKTTNESQTFSIIQHVVHMPFFISVFHDFFFVYFFFSLFIFLFSRDGSGPLTLHQEHALQQWVRHPREHQYMSPYYKYNYCVHTKRCKSCPALWVLISKCDSWCLAIVSDCWQNLWRRRKFACVDQTKQLRAQVTARDELPLVKANAFERTLAWYQTLLFSSKWTVDAYRKEIISFDEIFERR